MIVGIAHAGHSCGLGRQFSGEHAGHDVHFVGVRHRKNQLRLVYSGVLQHLRAGPRARQRLNVKRFLYLAQLRFVMVDDNDLPLFLGKPPCRMKADFSCADDDDPPGGRRRFFLKKHDYLM